MPTALITGITGFTGRYLREALRARGYEVAGIALGQSPQRLLYGCDLLDQRQLAEAVSEVQPDVVAHLAAISFVAHSDADAIYRTNVVGARNLLEALAGLRKKPRCVLLASSANVYGNTTAAPIDETVLPQPANDYAVSKLAMEYVARLYMERLPIIVVRPFNYTGVGQSLNFLLPKIVDHFARGAQEIELGNLDVARDFSDVRAVAEAYTRLLEAAPAGEVFNVCSGIATSLQDVLDLLGQIAGYPVRPTINPALVRASEVKRLHGSPVKLDAAIGATPRIPLADTLKWMLESATGGRGE